MSNIVESLYRVSGIDNLTEKLSKKSLLKIRTSPWGEDALGVVLNNISNKLDGYDDFGSGFDVSYQGSTEELLNELISVYTEAGIKIRKEKSNMISYDNDGQRVYIAVNPDEDASTYTENSQGYFIYVENVE